MTWIFFYRTLNTGENISSNPPPVMPLCPHVSLLDQRFSLLKPNMTQIEIERRSCCQSMTIFLFFNCGCQNNFTGCHYFCLMYLLRNLQKIWKKCPKSIQLCVCIRYCTDRTDCQTCATF